MDKRIIIGIAGQKNSGKNTVASMIRYMLHVGILNATYKEWIIEYDREDINQCSTIINYADFLKDICSTVFDIPRALFDNRTYKDNKYLLLDANKFVDENAKILEEYKVLRIEDFEQDLTLADYIDFNSNLVAIKLRTILQYVGTNVFRNCIKRNVFIDIAISKAINIKNKFGYCIIGDVRFKNEADAIRRTNGIIIEINRATNNNLYNHSSEQLNDINAEIIINNDDTKFTLFYKVMSAIKIIMSESSTGEKKQLVI